MRRALVVLVGAALFFAARESAAQEEEQATPVTAPEEPPVPAEPSPPKNPHLRSADVLRLDGGFASRRLYEIPIVGGDVSVGFGFERRWVVHTVSVRGLFGSTEYGLGVRAGFVGYDVDFIPFDRFRIGPGVGVAYLGVDRTVRNDTLTSWGLSFRGSARVDLARPDGFTLFARASIEYVALLEGEDTGLWGPSVGLGIDFDLSSRPRKR